LGKKALSWAIDFHVHPLPLLPDQLIIDEVEASGLEKCVLLAVDVDYKMLEEPGISQHMASVLFEAGSWGLYELEHAKVLLQLARTPNERVAKLVKEHPDVFVGVGSVNPAKGMEHVRKGLEEIRNLGLVGIKLLPTLQLFDPRERREELTAIFDFCSKHGLMLVLHTGCDPGPWELPALSECARPERYRPFVEAYPEVPVVLAHAGSYSIRHPGIWLDEALDLARANDNVWLDIAAVTYLAMEERFVKKIRDRVGFDRVLFGSDWPTVFKTTVSEALGRLMASKALTDQEKEAVARENARELLKAVL